MENERNALPAGWVWVTLSDVASVGSTQTLPKRTPDQRFNYLALEHIEPGTGRILNFSPTLGRDIESNKFTFKAGDVLYGKLRPYLRKATVAGFEGVSATDLIPLRSLGVIESSYLQRYLLSPRALEYVHPLMAGIKMPRLRSADLRALPIPLAPLPEQRRIVAKIEALFEQDRAVRAALGRIPRLLKKFRQAVLAAAFRGDLTRDWREEHAEVEPASALLDRIRAARRHKWEENLRAKGKDPRRTGYKEPRPVDVSELPKLSEQWAWTNVEWLAAPEPYALVDGPFGSHLKTADYANEGVRVVRLQNIGEGEFKDADWAFISHEKYRRLQRHSVYPDDLIIATLGDPVARVCRLPIDHPAAMVKADCIRFKVGPACAEPLYVMWALNTTDAHKRAEMAAHGVGRLRVNLDEIKQLPVPLAPLLEQRQIVARVEQLFARANAIETAVGMALGRADKLEQSILARAFRGELVSQDPNDEPASVLLERIRAARPAGTSPKGRRPSGH